MGRWSQSSCVFGRKGFSEGSQVSTDESVLFISIQKERGTALPISRGEAKCPRGREADRLYSSVRTSNGNRFWQSANDA